MTNTSFSNVASKVFEAVRSASGGPRVSSDKDSDWQRVNSYIADVLKDAHVLYAKLARLQGDFSGGELDNIEKISEQVLNLGGQLSAFSKAFYDGKASMSEDEGFDAPVKSSGNPPPAPPPEAAPAPDFGDDDEALDFSGEDEEAPDEKKKPSKGADVDIDFSGED